MLVDDACMSTVSSGNGQGYSLSLSLTSPWMDRDSYNDPYPPNADVFLEVSSVPPFSVILFYISYKRKWADFLFFSLICCTLVSMVEPVLLLLILSIRSHFGCTHYQTSNNFNRLKSDSFTKTA